MKSNIRILICLAILLVFGTSPERSSLAQQAESPAAVTTEVQSVITPVMSYQGRLLESGSPASGVRTMTFSLYNVSSGGTAFWTETQSVTVTDGLFQVALGAVTPFSEAVLGQMDQNLWLEIVVAATTLPRQQLMGAPYALSLAPGAAVTGSTSSTLLAANEGSGAGLAGQSATGHGVRATSNGVGLSGAALRAESTNVGGIAAWAITNGSDATLVTSNNGSGPLVKGFGGDGGEHEFVILNDGTLQQDLTASGLVKAAVYAYCANAGSTSIRSFNNAGGTIMVNNGTVGTCTIDFGFPVNDRYFMVTAPAVEGYIQDTFAFCAYVTGYPNLLACQRDTYTGVPNNGFIMVVVY